MGHVVAARANRTSSFWPNRPANFTPTAFFLMEEDMSPAAPVPCAFVVNPAGALSPNVTANVAPPHRMPPFFGARFPIEEGVRGVECLLVFFFLVLNLLTPMEGKDASMAALRRKVRARTRAEYSQPRAIVCVLFCFHVCVLLCFRRQIVDSRGRGARGRSERATKSSNSSCKRRGNGPENLGRSGRIHSLPVAVRWVISGLATVGARGKGRKGRNLKR